MKPALTFPNKEPNARSASAMFYSKFQRSLRECLRHGFSVEECFGLVWEETLDEIYLLEHEKGRLYEQLIDWARALPARTYSPLFTEVIHEKHQWNHPKH